MERITRFTVTQEAETYANYLLCLSLDIGEELLKSGAEINRVEDTIERICRAYGAVHVEVFAIHSLIMASVRLGDQSYSSQIRRVYASSMRLSHLEAINAVSRRICSEKPSLEEADRLIREARCSAAYSFWIFLAGCALTAASFTVFFGGNWFDALIAGLLGCLMAGVEKIHFSYINQMAKLLMVSFVIGCLANLSVLLGATVHVDAIIIGAIMLLIPGLAFGNSIRDLLCGDMLAGIIKTVQSCLCAVLIAFGFLLAALLMGELGLGQSAAPLSVSLWLELLMAALGTVGFAIYFQSRLRYLPLLALGGACTCLIYEMALMADFSPFLAAFVASLFNGLLATVSARVLRAPAIVFSSLGAISIVPGSGLYYTMMFLLSGAEVGSQMGRTLLVSSGLALGTVCLTVLTTVLTKAKK